MNLNRISIGLITAVLGFSSGASAKVDIAQDPLFLVQPVKPALIMGVDDSGSMDSELILPTNDGALWWNTDIQSFVGKGVDDAASTDIDEPGALNFNVAGGSNGTWKKYVYLFPNGHSGASGDRRRYADRNNDHFAIPPLPQFAYVRSPDYNSIYFDPSERYVPFASAGNDSFADSDPKQARVDPPRGNSTMDLTNPIEESKTNWVFKVYQGMTIPAGTRFKVADDETDCPLVDADSGSTINASNWTTHSGDTALKSSENHCLIAISYFPATFYVKPDTALPSVYDGYAGEVLIGYGPEGEELHGYEIKPANFPNGGYTEAIQNFANWFSYYRKRSLLTRAAMGRAFEDLDFLRVGAFEINDRNQVDMIDFDDATDRKAFFDSQYELRADGGTPNRQSVKHIGDQFANRTGSDAPIVEACQRNFGLLVTDGFSNDWNGAGVGNTDGPSTPDGEPDAFGAILSDSQSNTIADIAYNYYNTRLRTDLEAGLVTVPAACSQPNPSLALDCNKDLHMNLFAITLGAEGIVFGKDQTMTEDPFTNPPEWPTNFKNRSPTAVDDLWHATLNTRGEMFSAKRPSELVRSLSEVLSQIASRVEPVGITVSSARIDESSIFFVADLDSTTWSGNLTAFRFNEETDPEFDDPEVVWQATDPGNIAAADDRTIMTVVNGSVIPFRSGNNALNARVFGPDSTLTSAEKAQIIDYLRGDQSNELSTDGTTGEFRRRDTRLGDIANSRPVFAGPRNEGWARLDASYIDFLDSKDKELTPSYSPLALVGANDGMVHVFNADTGREVFAFIPSVLHSKLPQLSDPTYTHKLFVDGQIRVADAKISESGAVNGWNTVAVGALAGGGKGIYALNITNESSPEVLWELTDADDSDIGHVYDTPIVTRLSNGEWVVIFANGVNSGDEEPVLFVVNLKNGTIIDKVELGGNQDSPGNGLMSTAALMDPAERTSLARIYAGDLQGKMWRVDFTPSAEAQFNNSPLVDVERPLMAPPTLAPHPGGGVMVFFGTGKLIELSDRTNSGDIETFWAVRDRGSKISNARNLAEATINDTSEGRTITVGGEDVIDGWYLDLTSSSSGTGEKVLSRPRVVFGQAIFSTFEPLEDPCASGGFNRVYIVDAVGGVGRFDAKCQNCGVAELGEGAPVDPAIVIRQPTRPVLGNPSDSDGDGSPDIPSGPTGSDVGNTNEWCSVLNLLLPQDGLVEIGRICDGRQVWRRVPIEQ